VIKYKYFVFYIGGTHGKMGRKRAKGRSVYAGGAAEEDAHDQAEYK
jgi:hypothetical protein